MSSTTTHDTEAPGDLFAWVPTTAPTYPEVAGWKGEPGGPSQQAAEAIQPKVTGLRAKVLGVLINIGTDEALTADEIGVRLQRTPFSIRPRVAELHALALIERAPDRGKNESGMTASRWRIKRKATA